MNSYQLKNFPIEDFAYTPYLMIAGIGQEIQPINNDDFSHYSDSHFSITCNANLLSIVKNQDNQLVYVIFFRGYITTLGIDQNSPIEDIINNLDRLHQPDISGIYTLVVYEKNTSSTLIFNDSQGFSPLYYREDQQHLISNIAGALAFEEDDMDLIALRSIVSTGYIPNNRTLANQVKRFPEGVNIELLKGNKPKYQNNSSPKMFSPSRKIDETSIEESVLSFREVMKENLELNLKQKPLILPLSSGWDSRRILESMLHHNKRPLCYSAEVQNASGVDVDAAYAEKIAGHYNLQYQTITRPYIARDYQHCKLMRTLFSAESSEHTWSYKLFSAMPQNGYIFDGLAGDVSGNSGFGDTALYGHEENTKSVLVKSLISEQFDFLFDHGSYWPSQKCIENELLQHMANYPDNNLAPELLFLSLHTRRRTSLWGQAVSSPNSVVIAPFMSHKYLSQMLNIDPLKKFTSWMQQAILAKSNPELSEFTGSRDCTHSEKNPTFDKQCRAEDSLYIKSLIRALIKRKGFQAFSTLKPLQALLLVLYCYTPFPSKSIVWRYRQILEILHWWHIDRPRLTLGKTT